LDVVNKFMRYGVMASIFEAVEVDLGRGVSLNAAHLVEGEAVYDCRKKTPECGVLIL
jgi:hypothetical protein